MMINDFGEISPCFCLFSFTESVRVRAGSSDQKLDGHKTTGRALSVIWSPPSIFVLIFRICKKLLHFQTKKKPIITPSADASSSPTGRCPKIRSWCSIHSSQTRSAALWRASPFGLVGWRFPITPRSQLAQVGAVMSRYHVMN